MSFDNRLDQGEVGAPPVTQPPRIPPPEQTVEATPNASDTMVPVTQVLAPQAIPQRVGSGGAMVSTAAAFRAWLQANGMDQSHIDPSSNFIRIGDKVSEPEAFGLPSRVAVEQFGERGAGLEDLLIQSPVVQRYRDFLTATSVGASEHTPGGLETTGQHPDFITAPDGTVRGIAHPLLGDLSPADEAASVAGGAGARKALDALGQATVKGVGKGVELGLGAFGIRSPGTDAVGAAQGAINETIGKPWQSLLGRMLIAGLPGQTDYSNIANELVRQRLARKGISAPSYFDIANETGDLAGEVWAQASENGPPLIGGLAEAANPAWWVTAPLALGVKGALLEVGISERLAGFLESAIANGGLPYADHAINAVFLNSFTRGAARAIGARATDVTSAMVHYLESKVGGNYTSGFGAGFFARYEPKIQSAASISVDRQRDLLGLTRVDESPRSVMAQITQIVKENDDPALRENILGPGGGYERAASGGGRDRESMGLESTTGSRSGGGLQIGMGSTAVVTRELAAFRALHVDPYVKVRKTYMDAIAEIDQIEHSPEMEWGKLTTDDQFRVLANSDKDGSGKWEVFLKAYRAATNDEDRQSIVTQAREWGKELETFRRGNELPFGDEPGLLLAGDDSAPLLGRIEVLTQVARDAYQEARRLISDPTRLRPAPIEQVFTVRGKMIKGERSAHSFEIVDKTGRVVGTSYRSERAAQKAAHDLNVSRSGETTPPQHEGLAAALRPSEAGIVTEHTPVGDQVVMPGTPAKQAPDLVLATQDVSEATARSARGPAGEQGDLFSHAATANPGAGTNEALAASRGTPAAPGTGGALLPGSTPAERAAAIAKASADFNAAAASTPSAPKFEVRGGQVVDTTSGKVHNDLTNGTWPAKVHQNDPARAAQIRADWANKKVANGTWEGRDSVNLAPGEKAVPADAQVVGAGEKAVPKDAPIAQPPGKGPPRPPRKTTEDVAPGPEGDESERAAEEEMRLLDEEDLGPAEPSQVITRVVDNKDGTFSLGTLDLEKGMVIKGERFTDRESAIRTAEARNAENDAVTMVEDTMSMLRDTLEGIPPQLALMSPGQAALTRRALTAERAAADKAEIIRRTKYLRDAEDRGELADKRFVRETMRLARLRAQRLQEGLAVEGVDPARTHLALPGPSGKPLTRTAADIAKQDADLAALAKQLDRVHAREVKVAARERAKRITAELRKAGVPEAKARALTDDEKSIVADRMAESRRVTALREPPNIKTAAKALINEVIDHPGSVLPGAFSAVARTVLTGYDASVMMQRLIGIAIKEAGMGHGLFLPKIIKTIVQSYATPKVVHELAAKEFDRAVRNGGRMLKYNAEGEFTGESVSQKVLDLVESVPVIGEGFRRSNVAFNEPLNYTRAKRFNSIVEDAERRGHPYDQETKDHLAWVLNHETGFAYRVEDLPTEGLKGAFAQTLHHFGALLFSRQWQASRVAVYADLARAMKHALPGQKFDVADKESLLNGMVLLATNVGLIAGAAKTLGVDPDTFLDWKSNHFGQVPLGQAGGLDKAALAAALEISGVPVVTNSTTGEMYADFTRGLGSDARLFAQILPFGGPNGLISGVNNVDGAEKDPYNPKYGQRDVSSILVDWTTGHSEPIGQVVGAAINPFGIDSADDRVHDALLRSSVVMWLSSAFQAGDGWQGMGIDKFMEGIKLDPRNWFATPSAAPSPTTGPTIPPTRSRLPGALPPPP